jgi:hypothetical protein
MVPTYPIVILKNEKKIEKGPWDKRNHFSITFISMPGFEVYFREKSFRQLRAIDLVCEGRSMHECRTELLGWKHQTYAC